MELGLEYQDVLRSIGRIPTGDVDLIKDTRYDTSILHVPVSKPYTRLAQTEAAFTSIPRRIPSEGRGARITRAAIERTSS